MSDAGLYSGLYEQIRECAELVDDVLIALKSGSSRPADGQRRKLGEFLIILSRNRRDDFAAQRLLAVLGTKAKAQPDWASLGSALLAESEDVRLITPLETLPRSLEDEQVSVTTRMRGGTR